MRKFYVTTPIYYPSSNPHLGHAYTDVIADVIARFKRKEGFDVFFLTGTDEHGFKIQEHAKGAGKTPRQFVNEMSERFEKLGEALNLSNDDFIRTTDKKRHWPGVELIWKKIEKKGDVYKKKYKGLYCSGCEVFKKEKELVDGKCPDHDKEPELVEEENYFFKLSKYREKIEELIKKEEVKIAPESGKKEILNFLGKGLDDVSVSRSVEKLSWGIPVPGDEKQILYVWLDALSNYISAIGYGRDEENFKKWWPADVHCVGKDILRFHSVIWIGMLLSAGLEVPKNILVHGHITSEGRKMSKTIGNVVDPFEIVKEYGTDAVRYYLLREIPAFGDGDFSEKKFKERYNADLADGLGNLISRTVALAGKHESIKELPGEDIEKKVREIKKEAESFLEKFKFNEALGSAWKLIHFADRYIEEKKPWEKKEESVTVVKNLIYISASLSEMLSPFMPETAERIKKKIQKKEKSPLFPKLK